VCDNKRQFCEFQNSGPDGSISLNEDGDFKETPSFFLDPEDPKCKEKEHPLICDEPIDAETGLRQFFRPSSTPSKFVEDNDAGHDLIKTKSGPIGKGFKTLVTDNGNATFTAGNLKTFSRNFALQLGCHFDVRSDDLLLALICTHHDVPCRRLIAGRPPKKASAQPSVWNVSEPMVSSVGLWSSPNAKDLQSSLQRVWSSLWSISAWELHD
jgi:hypothetical protein